MIGVERGRAGGGIIDCKRGDLKSRYAVVVLVAYT